MKIRVEWPDGTVMVLTVEQYAAFNAEEVARTIATIIYDDGSASSVQEG